MKKRVIYEESKNVLPDHITVRQDDENDFQNHTGTIFIPLDTESPYAGGTFVVKITIPNDYPFSPPKMKMVTNINHMNFNINNSFELYILLSGNWSCAYKFRTVLLNIYELIIEPDPYSPFKPALARLYRDDRAEHD